jgi:hypothetical protein
MLNPKFDFVMSFAEDVFETDIEVNLVLSQAEEDYYDQFCPHHADGEEFTIKYVCLALQRGGIHPISNGR